MESKLALMSAIPEEKAKADDASQCQVTFFALPLPKQFTSSDEEEKKKEEKEEQSFAIELTEAITRRELAKRLRDQSENQLTLLTRKYELQERRVRVLDAQGKLREAKHDLEEKQKEQKDLATQIEQINIQLEQHDKEEQELKAQMENLGVEIQRNAILHGNVQVVDEKTGVVTSELTGGRNYYRQEDAFGSFIPSEEFKALTQSEKKEVLRRTYEHLSLEAHDQNKAGGSTLSTCVVQGDTIFASKAGNGRIIAVVIDENGQIVPQDQKAMIVSASGTALYDESKTTHNKNVVWADPILHSPDQEVRDPRLKNENIDRGRLFFVDQKTGRHHIEVHRSINDFDFREVGLRSDPDFFQQRFTVPRGGKLLVFSFCDGAFDRNGALTDDDIAHTITAVTGNKTPSANDLAQISRNLVTLASEKGSKDNITCSAVMSSSDEATPKCMWVADGHGGQEASTGESTSEFIQENIQARLQEETVRLRTALEFQPYIKLTNDYIEHLENRVYSHFSLTDITKEGIVSFVCGYLNLQKEIQNKRESKVSEEEVKKAENNLKSYCDIALARDIYTGFPSNPEYVGIIDKLNNLQSEDELMISAQKLIELHKLQVKLQNHDLPGFRKQLQDGNIVGLISQHNDPYGIGWLRYIFRLILSKLGLFDEFLKTEGKKYVEQATIEHKAMILPEEKDTYEPPEEKESFYSPANK